MPPNHEPYIRKCIQIARQTCELGNPPFAALLTKNDDILLEAMNTQVTDNDFTSHAEFKLLKKAVRIIEPEILIDSTLYCSNEPCPMCVGAIYWGGIRRVVYGCGSGRLMSIRGHGWPIPCKDIFSKATEHVEVIGPILEEEVIPLLKHYYAAM